jgi:hypothetical protein
MTFLPIALNIGLSLFIGHLSGMCDPIFLSSASAFVVVWAIEWVLFWDIIEFFLIYGDGVGDVGGLDLCVLRGDVLIGEYLEFHLLRPPSSPTDVDDRQGEDSYHAYCNYSDDGGDIRSLLK